jgi:histone H3/H4
MPDIPRKIMHTIIRDLIRAQRKEDAPTTATRITRKALRLLHEEVEALAKELFESAHLIEQKMQPGRKTLQVEALQVARMLHTTKKHKG